jgi:hypothetical protein
MEDGQDMSLPALVERPFGAGELNARKVSRRLGNLALAVPPLDLIPK